MNPNKLSKSLISAVNNRSQPNRKLRRLGYSAEYRSRRGCTR